MVNRSWISSRLFSHSCCASDSDSESRTLLEMDGSESTSSLSLDGEGSGIRYDSEADMAGAQSQALFVVLAMFTSARCNGRRAEAAIRSFRHWPSGDPQTESPAPERHRHGWDATGLLPTLTHLSQGAPTAAVTTSQAEEKTCIPSSTSVLAIICATVHKEGERSI